jgi:hypothetical protein
MQTIKTNLLLTLAAAALFALLPAKASAACTYSVSSPSVAVAHSGGWVSVPIYTQPGCAWIATAANAWASMSVNRGSGNGVITFYVAPNTGRTARFTNVGETYYVPDNCLGGRSSSGCGGGYYTRLFNISVTQY